MAGRAPPLRATASTSRKALLAPFQLGSCSRWTVLLMIHEHQTSRSRRPLEAPPGRWQPLLAWRCRGARRTARGARRAVAVRKDGGLGPAVGRAGRLPGRGGAAAQRAGARRRAQRWRSGILGGGAARPAAGRVGAAGARRGRCGCVVPRMRARTRGACLPPPLRCPARETRVCTQYESPRWSARLVTSVVCAPPDARCRSQRRANPTTSLALCHSRRRRAVAQEGARQRPLARKGAQARRHQGKGVVKAGA